MKHRSSIAVPVTLARLTMALLAAAPLAAQVPPARPVQPAPPVPPVPYRVIRSAPPYPFEAEDRAREALERAREVQGRAQERALEALLRAQERAQETQERAAERAHELQQREQERATERAREALERQHEVQQNAMERQHEAMERAREVQERAMERSFHVMPPLPPLPRMPAVPPTPSFNFNFNGPGSSYHLPESPRAPWAQNDPADSLYRAAREALNRGDYRKAAAMFKDVPVRFQYSVYAPDAMYWQAHSLYRIGNTPDLQEALTVLETLKQKYPSTRTREQKDVGELSMRIAGTLSSRGLAGNDIVKRALAQSNGAATCDSEDQSVRAQALSALMETDSDAAAQLAQRILAKKDECSVQLRKNAVMIAARKRDGPTLAALTAVAKSDPSSEVRQYAVRYIASMPGDEALAAIEELLKSSDDQNVQREAVKVLATHTSPRARQAARAIIERNDAQESLRLSALRAFDRDRATTDDATWLRGIYARVDNPRVKAEMVSTITRIGGEGMDAWLLTLARDDNESVDARNNAVRRAAQTMDIPSLGKFYDNVPQGRLRQTIIDVLGNRPEATATDKLLDIVKSSTDYQLRGQAISALTRKKDPRATQLLIELIDKKAP